MNDGEIKILIVRLSALGDIIHTLPLLSALKELYPSSHIDWVVEDKAAAFLRNADSYEGLAQQLRCRRLVAYRVPLPRCGARSGREQGSCIRSRLR